MNKGYIALALTVVFAFTAFLFLETSFSPLLAIPSVQYYPLHVEVFVKFTDGSPVQGASVSFEDRIGEVVVATDSNGFAEATVDGVVSGEFEFTSSNVQVLYEPSSYVASKTAIAEVIGGGIIAESLVTFSDVPLPSENGEPPEPPVQPTYDLVISVRDQAGNVLAGANVDFVGMIEKTTDSNGEVSESFDGSQDVIVLISFTRAGKTFTATETIMVDSSKTVVVTVDRLFHWGFRIEYDDGSAPDGDLTLTSSQETVVIFITSGGGEGWLNNYQYSLSFEASPATSLGSLSVTNDGEASYEIESVTGKVYSEITSEDVALDGTILGGPMALCSSPLLSL